MDSVDPKRSSWDITRDPSDSYVPEGLDHILVENHGKPGGHCVVGLVIALAQAQLFASRDAFPRSSLVDGTHAGAQVGDLLVRQQALPHPEGDGRPAPGGVHVDAEHLFDRRPVCDLDQEHAQAVDVKALLEALALLRVVRLGERMSVEIVLGVVAGAGDVRHLVCPGRPGEVEARQVRLRIVDLAAGGAEEDDVVTAQAFVEPVHGMQVEQAVADGMREPDPVGHSRLPGGLEQLAERDGRQGRVEDSVERPLEYKTEAHVQDILVLILVLDAVGAGPVEEAQAVRSPEGLGFRGVVQEGG